MRKYLLLLPLMAILFSSCSESYSREEITGYCTSTLPQYESAGGEKYSVLPAEGGTIQIRVESTHSFVMTSIPQEACEFTAYGVVNFSKEGVALVATYHNVLINPNTTNKGRYVSITAKQRHNPDIVTTIPFYQPAQATPGL